MRAIVKVGLAGVLCVVALGGSWNFVSAQAPPASMYGDLRWRIIGPFRGGRTKAAAGVPSQPNVFYIGVTTAAFGRRPTTAAPGRRSSTISPPVRSARSPSRHPIQNIIYVGSGEGLQRPDLSVGDGIYKSTDAGKNLDAPRPARRPADSADRGRSDAIPNRLFVAVLGHPYGPNEERGIFRSTDGGKNFEKVLYKDENTGGADV